MDETKRRVFAIRQDYKKIKMHMQIKSTIDTVRNCQFQCKMEGNVWNKNPVNFTTLKINVEVQNKL